MCSHAFGTLLPLPESQAERAAGKMCGWIWLWTGHPAPPLAPCGPEGAVEPKSSRARQPSPPGSSPSPCKRTRGKGCPCTDCYPLREIPSKGTANQAVSQGVALVLSAAPANTPGKLRRAEAHGCSGVSVSASIRPCLCGAAPPPKLHARPKNSLTSDAARSPTATSATRIEKKRRLAAWGTHSVVSARDDVLQSALQLCA